MTKKICIFLFSIYIFLHICDFFTTFAGKFLGDLTMKIAFTTKLPAEGFHRLSEHELYAPLEESEVLVSTFDKPVTRQMIERAPHLRLVTNFGV